MSLRAFAGLLLGAAMAFTTGDALALSILTPADTIIAIDTDPAGSSSNYPGGEAPMFVLDGDSGTKYLNFAGGGSGFIVTPNIGVDSIAEAIRLTTANDAPGRDPSSFEVWGTSDPITSVDNGTGLAESWNLLGTGALTLPEERLTVGDLVPFANTDGYRSYKILFPTVKDSSLMQVADVELIGDVPAVSVFDTNLLVNDTATQDSMIAVHLAADSSYPSAENPGTLLDYNNGSKYLNFGATNSGFIVTPDAGASTVKTFRITTANDHPERDPAEWELYGTNEGVVSEDNSQGDAEGWTLISSGSVALPEGRQVNGPFVSFDNDTAYTSYKMVFTSLVDGAAANSMQIADIQFYDVAIPEPSCLVLCGLAAVAAATTRRANG